MSVFSNKRITGKGPAPRRPVKFSPGSYLVRVVKGVHVESQMGHGTFAGIECKILAVETKLSAEQNAPHDATRNPGTRAAWTFKMHTGALEDVSLQNLANIAEALIETHGFDDCLTADEQADLMGLLESAESGDEDADPVGYVLDLMMTDGGEKFSGLPLRIEAEGKISKAGNLFPVCRCIPVTQTDIDAAQAA